MFIRLCIGDRPVPALVFENFALLVVKMAHKPDPGVIGVLGSSTIILGYSLAFLTPLYRILRAAVIPGSDLMSRNDLRAFIQCDSLSRSTMLFPGQLIRAAR